MRQNSILWNCCPISTLLPAADEEWLQGGDGPPRRKAFPWRLGTGGVRTILSATTWENAPENGRAFGGTRTPSQELPSPRWPKPMDGTARKRNPES